MNRWSEQKLREASEAYFRGTLGETEEAQLRQQLAASPTETGAIGEAKALMGFFATARRQQREAPTARTKLRAARIAVAAACAAAVAWAAWHYSSPRETDCIMYAEGQVITSEEAVMAQMTAQITEMGRQADAVEQTVRSQLGDFKQLISGQK